MSSSRIKILSLRPNLSLERVENETKQAPRRTLVGLSLRLPPTTAVGRAGLLAASMCLCADAQTPAPFPVDKPAATPLAAWTAQAEKCLPVTAKLQQDSASQGFGMNTSTFRVWKVEVQVRNSSGQALETGDEFLVLETSLPAPAGARDPSPLQVTSGGFNLKPFEDYGGVHEKLGGDVDDEEAHGLYNIQSVGTGGGMMRRMGNMTTISFGGEGREWRTYGRAAAGGSLKFEADFQAAVHVVEPRLDRVVVIPPALILRNQEKSAVFRYLLTFARETQGTKEGWKLEQAQLLAMQAEALLAILNNAQEPLWRRVFAASWAGEHDYAAAKPALVALIDSRGKINERLRIAGLSGLAADKDAELTAKVMTIAKDRSEDKRVRWAALRALGQLADPSATQFLVGVMNGKDDAEAGEAIVALRLSRDPAAAEPLLACLQNPKRERKHSAAAKALALVADNRHLPALSKLAGSKTRGTADAAVTAMAGVKTTEAVTALAQVATAGGEGSGKAIESLGESDLPDAIASLKRLLAEGKPETKDKAVDAIGARDTPERVALLRESLASSEWSVRKHAAERLGELKVSATAADLAALLKDEEKSVRSAAATALSKLDVEAAAAPLASALEDKEAEVRQAAIRGLGRLGSPASLPALQAAWKEPADRDDVARALGGIKSPQSVEALVPATTDAETSVRHAATQALRQLDYPRSVDLLVGMLDDKDESVKRNAAASLAELTGQELGPDSEAWSTWWAANKVRYEPK